MTQIPDDVKEFVELLLTVLKKYEAILNHSPVMIALVDRDGKFIEANPAMAESVGTNPVGKSFYDIFSRDVADRRARLVKLAINTGNSVMDQDERDSRHFLTHYYPLSIGGKDLCLIMATEITEVIRVKKLLKTMNRISRIILHERDVNTLVERICDELYSVNEFCGVKIHLLDGIHETLAVRGDPGKAERYKIDLRIDGETRGTIEVCTDRPLNGEELELLTAMANDLAFGIKLMEMAMQLEYNISCFASLVDGIRNPLTAIRLVTELSVKDERVRETILRQVDKIAGIVSLLDEGWLQSERILKTTGKIFSSPEGNPQTHYR